MYPTRPHVVHNRRAYAKAVVDHLPEVVWSEFLGRETRWTPQQVAIAIAVAKSKGQLTQREIADKVGCRQGTVSKTLAMMRRLGVLAVSTTRGCRGSTVAWFRRGVRRLTGRMIRPQRTTLGSSRYNVVVGVESSTPRGGPPAPVSALFAAMTGG